MNILTRFLTKRRGGGSAASKSRCMTCMTQRAPVRDAEAVTLLYSHDSKWMRFCEWVGRRVEAAYPKKRIKRAGVDLHLQPDLMMTQLRCTRLLDPKGVTEDRVERWLIDLADYAIIYMQPLLCMGSGSGRSACPSGRRRPRMAC